MNVNQITMDKQEAAAKYSACVAENHQDSYEFNTACARAYECLAEGKRLLRLSHSIRQAGLNEKGFPKLAIARADRKQVFFSWPRNNSVARFCSAADTSWWGNSSNRWPQLNLFVDLRQEHTDDRYYQGRNGRHGYALVPGVPAYVRPETGQLRQWFVLWEVEEWADRPFIAPAPHDPFLLEHIGGDLYVILAEWDLTEVERAILEEMNQ